MFLGGLKLGGVITCHRANGHHSSQQSWVQAGEQEVLAEWENEWMNEWVNE